MKFEEKYSWTKRSKKLLKDGSSLKKEGIIIINEVVKLLNLPLEKILLVDNFTHLLIETSVVQLLIPAKPQTLLKQALTSLKNFAALNVPLVEMVRYLYSIHVTFNYKNWKITLKYDTKSKDAVKHAWVRDFLLNEINHEQIAKLTSLIAAGIKNESAFKDMLQNWIPDNLVIRRLVEMQLQNKYDKPLVKFKLSSNGIEEYIYEKDSWVKK